MSNIIAVIWDCDKTLVDGYMQDPIFEEYGIDATEFWHRVNTEADRIAGSGIRVNRDTYYLNYFIRAAHGGELDGLNNARLREFGQRLRFYPGILEILEQTRTMFQDDKLYAEYNIRVEHYIVSTGFAEVIRGSRLCDLVDGIWGCELLEAPDADGRQIINETVYTVDNTSKTRAIFEINKGIGKDANIDVNSRIAEENRRVQMRNMIYIADGPSDIPAFSVVKKGGGTTFAIYPRGDLAAMQQVEQMRQDGRVDMYAEADYSANTTAYMWITSKIQMMADRIRDEERRKIERAASAVPRHLV